MQETDTESDAVKERHDGKLMQVAVSGTGLGMRGAEVKRYQHFDHPQELRWHKRKLCYTVLTKAQRQAAEADSKTVNTRVSNAMATRNEKNNKAHKPVLDHPCREYPDGKSAPEECNATL